ncbi:capsule biosynthesis protein [Oceanimonas marisflavi]|uniref:capsule biosynthesis protein n=1 Tax=Oceanimonas marisflavi TaxID=2059724 RepID=UPI000D31A544|nr:capsular biosynthesis protein [Oceanimonas marisflavi]
MESVLLLQGPLGPFFQHFSRFLSEQGISVHKIHFNGGDGCWPCQGTNVHYTGSLQEWRHFLQQYISEHRIDTVFCYSDCRKYHAVARHYCLSHNIRFFVFEEGYLRPHYITLEQNGVNAHSPWYGKLAQELPQPPPEQLTQRFDVGPNYRRRIVYAMRYYFSMHCSRWRFRHYVHHRHRHCWQEGIAWLKGWYTKYLHRHHDSTLQRWLLKCHSRRIFLVPLQVADDFQIRVHSPFNDMAEAIRHIMRSFAASASRQDVLLFKHHPMDRGHINYDELINELATKLDLEGRVFYGFELQLPMLYPHCKGVVTINSTVGLSALLHQVPTITLGKALYDIPGLTSQTSLARFWRTPQPVKVDLFMRLRAFLLHNTQLNGSFYCEPDNTCRQVWLRLQQLLNLPSHPTSQPVPLNAERKPGRSQEVA